MTDTTDPREGGSEHAELLRDLDSGAIYGGRTLSNAAAAIRALEAKVEEVRNSRDDCMRCDRLAREVERLRNHAPMGDGCTCWSYTSQEKKHADNCVVTVHAAEVARLTSALAAARENEARWLWMFPADPLISVTERMQRVYRKWDGSDSWNDAVDAARRAGEGER